MTWEIFEDEWKKELHHRINAEELIKMAPEIAKKFKINRNNLKRIDNGYPIAITRHYASLIDWNDSDDPLLKIIFPNSQELLDSGLPDQSGEKLNTKKTGLEGLQHKYKPTALILVTGNCAAYCRFCFRRRFVGTQKEIVKNIDQSLEYISKHKEISNVLLSGGDSFMLNNESIEYILEKLSKIEHIKMVRFGTKMPVYLPARFDDEKLLEILAKYNTEDKGIYVISHIDHPRELCAESIRAHKKLIKKGCSILSQTVFAKGINDSAEILTKLFRKMATSGIRPYYLFQCRPVIGATHFSIPLLDGSQIVEQTRRNLSGIAKTFRYIMSHVSGKIEIISVIKQDIDRLAILKYHQARDQKYVGNVMGLAYDEPAYWLDDILKNVNRTIFYGNDAANYAEKQITSLSNV